MNISKETFDATKKVMEKYGPSVMPSIGVAGMIASAEINKKRREELANAYSQMNASYEQYKLEVKRNRSIFYRVKMFFRRLFHK